MESQERPRRSIVRMNVNRISWLDGGRRRESESRGQSAAVRMEETVGLVRRTVKGKDGVVKTLNKKTPTSKLLISPQPRIPDGLTQSILECNTDEPSLRSIGNLIQRFHWGRTNVCLISHGTVR
jgi:hypothetical protein